MATTAQRQQKFRKKLRIRAKGIFNFRCCKCFSKESLEFAHKEPCYLGAGRGGTLRMVQINLNPEKYILLCHDCHVIYDSKF